jgi:hypothetical protein
VRRSNIPSNLNVGAGQHFRSRGRGYEDQWAAENRIYPQTAAIPGRAQPMTAREATAITLCALFILFGLLLFKALDPRPRCDSLLLAIIYDTDKSCL